MKNTYLTQTATELCTIVSNGRLHSVYVQTVNGITLCRWRNGCNRLECLNIPNGEMFTLVGHEATKAIKPYRKREQIAMREQRRRKRRKEQERRKRLKNVGDNNA